MDFPSNSHNDKNEPKEKPKKEVHKVVTGEVVQKKQPLSRKIKSIFFDGQFKNAFNFIANDVLLPALKNMVVDATSKGVERVIYGDSPSRRRYGYDQNRPRISYNQPIDRRPRIALPDQPPYPPPYSAQNRRRDAGEIILVSRSEAELVLERLNDIVDKYDVASVADLHDLVGLPTSYVDNKWGWTNISNAGIRQVREGFLIDLPPVEPI